MKRISSIFFIGLLVFMLSLPLSCKKEIQVATGYKVVCKTCEKVIEDKTEKRSISASEKDKKKVEIKKALCDDCKAKEAEEDKAFEERIAQAKAQQNKGQAQAPYEPDINQTESSYFNDGTSSPNSSSNSGSNTDNEQTADNEPTADDYPSEGSPGEMLSNGAIQLFIFPNLTSIEDKGSFNVPGQPNYGPIGYYFVPIAIINNGNSSVYTRPSDFVLYPIEPMAGKYSFSGTTNNPINDERVFTGGEIKSGEKVEANLYFLTYKTDYTGSGNIKDIIFSNNGTIVCHVN